MGATKGFPMFTYLSGHIMSLWPMKDSDPFIPRFISFEGGKVVPVGRQAILDPDDTASTAFFTTQTVSEKHAELFFRQGAFYVR